MYATSTDDTFIVCFDYSFHGITESMLKSKIYVIKKKRIYIPVEAFIILYFVNDLNYSLTPCVHIV